MASAVRESENGRETVVRCNQCLRRQYSLSTYLVWTILVALDFWRTSTLASCGLVSSSTIVGQGNLEENLDLRVTSALDLFGRAQEDAGETSLRIIAEECPSFAPAHFYLGLLWQTRGHHVTAVEYYASTLRAGHDTWPIRSVLVTFTAL